MNPLLIYLIKSSLSLVIFYIAYLLFFRKQIDFFFNRYYLVLAVLLATLLPLISGFIPVNFHNPINRLATVQLQEISIGSYGFSTTQDGGFDFVRLLWWFYLTGIIFMSLRLLISLVRLLLLVKKSEYKEEDDCRIVFTKQKLPVFSFFRWIFINKDLYENPDAKYIIKHEKEHVNQLHSLDLLFIEIVSIFQWFNPFVHLMKKSIRENHEFIADSGITRSGFERNQLQKLLFFETTGIEFNSITHNFSYSLLKKRMMMMKNHKRQKSLSAKLFWALLALTVTLFACNNPTQPSHKTEAVKTPKPISQPPAVSIKPDTSVVFTVVEQMPEFPGGKHSFMSYLSKNLVYPEQAKKAKIKGLVFVNFIVEKNGKISNVKVLRGIGYGCDEEAVKAVQNMPLWKPGYQRGKAVRVSYNIPIKFSLK